MIYRNDKRYIIISAYLDPSGIFALSFPVFFLPLSATREELYNDISLAMDATRNRDYKELNTKSFLKAIKVSSLRKLYHDYTTCLIMDSGAEIKIEQYIYDGRYRESDGILSLSKSLISSMELVDKVLLALEHGDMSRQ